jgi:HYR domain-containing protein
MGAAVCLLSATSSMSSASGTLNLQEALRLVSDLVPCPPDGPPNATECRARTGEGALRGLGAVSATYTWAFRMGPPTCPPDLGKPLATAGRLTVQGKGEIRFSLADGAHCIPQEPIRNEPQDFTITGGTGPFEGASGSGTLTRSVSGGSGSERWTGTLVAPAFEFDLTPPAFSGARAKTVRAPKGAKRVRVTYKVTASDAVDGRVRATCAPRSGSRFRIGRTIVRCSATDSSANTGRASFRVTVRRG